MSQTSPCLGHTVGEGEGTRKLLEGGEHAHYIVVMVLWVKKLIKWGILNRYVQLTVCQSYLNEAV